MPSKVACCPVRSRKGSVQPGTAILTAPHLRGSEKLVTLPQSHSRESLWLRVSVCDGLHLPKAPVLLWLARTAFWGVFSNYFLRRQIAAFSPEPFFCSADFK